MTADLSEMPMKIILVRVGNALRPKSGQLPPELPKKITIELEGTKGKLVGSAKVSKRPTRTKHGRRIVDEKDIADRKCPYPYEPDL
jgi:hypothetical protein